MSFDNKGVILNPDIPTNLTGAEIAGIGESTLDNWPGTAMKTKEKASRPARLILDP